MAELVTAALVKALLPLFINLARDASSLVKISKFNINAQGAAEKLSKKIIDICTVKTMWSKDAGVPITQFYYPSKILRRNNALQTIPLTRLFRERCVIEGIVGQGKSILLRHLCQLAVENELIPVFVELKDISRERKLESLILNFLESAKIEGGEFVFSYLASTGRIVLLLDGFDEISKEHVLSTMYEIEQLRNKYEALGIIISSRPYAGIQSMASFDVYCLASLAQHDYDGFLSRLISDPVKRFNVRQAIEDAPENIKDVITTPLMLTLLVMVYESESEIPSSLPDFFDRLFGTVFSRHDRLKAGFSREHYSGLSESLLQKFFDSFCFMLMQAGGQRDVDRGKFRDAFERAVRYAPDCVCDLDAFRKDIVDVACLMLDDGFDVVTFLHKSIMEYHAASFIKNSSENFANIFYARARENYEDWEAVLLFLSSIDEFRYGREYVLKEYSELLTELGRILGSKNKSDLLDFLCDLYPNLSFLVNSHSLVGITVGPHSSGFIQKVTELLFDVVSGCLKSADFKAIHRAIRESPAKNIDELSIAPRAFFEHFDISAIWTGLAEIESSFVSIVGKYEKIVATENRKSNIFE